MPHLGYRELVVVVVGQPLSLFGRTEERLQAVHMDLLDDPRGEVFARDIIDVLTDQYTRYGPMYFGCSLAGRILPSSRVHKTMSSGECWFFWSEGWGTAAARSRRISALNSADAAWSARRPSVRVRTNSCCLGACCLIVARELEMGNCVRPESYFEWDLPVSMLLWLLRTYCTKLRTSGSLHRSLQKRSMHKVRTCRRIDLFVPSTPLPSWRATRLRR